MASMEPPENWTALVNDAIEQLLADLLANPEQRTALLGEPAGVDEPVDHLREQLFDYSTRLLAAAAAGAASYRCNNGQSTVDVQFILRPNQTPYYRCVGHSPPDCYDAQYNTIVCP